MPKRNLTLYIDAELIENAKIRGICISREFNEFLKAKIIGIDAIKPISLENIDRTKMEIENKIIALTTDLKQIEDKRDILIKKDDDALKRRFEELTS